jgi:hypothetical protein
MNLSEFWVGFLANLCADALLAIGIYIALTRPGEKRRASKRRAQALGLLKYEVEMNQQRSERFLGCLAAPNSIQKDILPLQYSRGAWNALKETGLLVEVADPELTYYLFRMNEATYTANKNLRRFELAHFENTGGKLTLLAEIARADCQHFLRTSGHVMERLKGVRLVEFGLTDVPSEVLDSVK